MWLRNPFSPLKFIWSQNLHLQKNKWYVPNLFKITNATISAWTCSFDEFGKNWLNMWFSPQYMGSLNECVSGRHKNDSCYFNLLLLQTSKMTNLGILHIWVLILSRHNEGPFIELSDSLIRINYLEWHNGGTHAVNVAHSYHGNGISNLLGNCVQLYMKHLLLEQVHGILLQGSQRFPGIKFHDFSMIFHDSHHFSMIDMPQQWLISTLIKHIIVLWMWSPCISL